MKRRFARILPAYLPMLLLWVVVTYPTIDLSHVQVLRGLAGNLFMDGYWMDAPARVQLVCQCAVSVFPDRAGLLRVSGAVEEAAPHIDSPDGHQRWGWRYGDRPADDDGHVPSAGAAAGRGVWDGLAG